MILFIFILACEEEKANLDMVDSLISVGAFSQASDILYTLEMKSYTDTMQIKRINARIDILKRKRVFRQLDKYIYEKNWLQAEKNIDSIKLVIKHINKSQKEFYLFDFYYRSAILDSAKNDNENYLKNMEKAVEYSTNEHENLWRLYEKIAFYYAQQGEYTKARENLDKALRKTDLNRITEKLKQIFTIYMNGDFIKARDLLIALPDSTKDQHWETTQMFLDKYAHKLTMEDRFKLW
jgi:tetratricopeptide (TPR) repeat protein